MCYQNLLCNFFKNTFPFSTKQANSVFPSLFSDTWMSFEFFSMVFLRLLYCLRYGRGFCWCCYFYCTEFHISIYSMASSYSNRLKTTIFSSKQLQVCPPLHKMSKEGPFPSNWELVEVEKKSILSMILRWSYCSGFCSTILMLTLVN